jgi:hypothetical protein
MTKTYRVGELTVSLVVESEFPVLTPSEVYPDSRHGLPRVFMTVSAIS